MKLIDPHIHMAARTTDDYEKLAAAGFVAVVEPAFWAGSDRRYAESFLDYFHHLSTFEPGRARQYGLAHYCVIGVNPKEANNARLARQVIEAMPEYLERPTVLGIGEIGFDRLTDTEEEVLLRQLDLAEQHGVPVVIHSPHTNKARGVERLCRLIETRGYTRERIILDHNEEDTIAMSKQLGVWCGHTVYPTKLSPERVTQLLKEHGTDRMIVNSSADWGPSDPLSVYRTVDVMRGAGFSEDELRKVVYDNPFAFFSQSEKFKIE